MRVLVEHEPFTDKSRYWPERGIWPAKLVGHPEVTGTEPAVVAYRRRFRIETAAVIRVHVTADERYELFLDGQRVGRGPERGDIENWFFESYDLDLASGDHILVARTWWLGADGPAPNAQISVRPGFLLATEGTPAELLNTGVSCWESKKLGGYSWLSPGMAWGTGAKVHIKGDEFSWGFEYGDGDDWMDAVNVSEATNASVAIVWPRKWMLRPATLPAMLEETRHVGEARHVEIAASDDTGSTPIRAEMHQRQEAKAWNLLLKNQSCVTIPQNTIRRVIWDLGDYYCAYPKIVLSGGNGSIVRMLWAESLFEATETGIKGNRDAIEGKIFKGVGDTFETDGACNREFETLWWEAGRYVEILVRTRESPLVIESLSLRETRYPLNPESSFECADHRLGDVRPIAVRALQECSHETFMDCPYYEQLMYVGDTRLEALATYALTHDDRLPRKALLMFDKSRMNAGLTMAQYPSRIMQIIPPFSLWWVSMVHDFAMWRNDPAFILARMPGVRAVIDAYLSFVNSSGFIESPNGWNFFDWVPDWYMGMPPDGEHGISSVINWQFVMALNQTAELESMFGEVELAARDRRLAEALAKRITEAFWDDGHGLFADDLAKNHYSEHAQCLALLSGGVVDERKIRSLGENLLRDPDLARATIYFKHYLFETYRLLGKMDSFVAKMEEWFDLKELGLKTTIEAPEPTRSDCHGWGAHPIFHYSASILGIRPSAPGFAEVSVKPQLGTLSWARGTMPHPKGFVRAEFSVDHGKLVGKVELPDGITGTLEYGGGVLQLHPGVQEISMESV